MSLFLLTGAEFEDHPEGQGEADRAAGEGISPGESIVGERGETGRVCLARNGKSLACDMGQFVGPRALMGISCVGYAVTLQKRYLIVVVVVV